MPIVLQVDDHKNFVDVRVSGVVTLEDVLGHIESVLAQGLISCAKLVDAKEAEPSFSESDMEILGDGVRALRMFHSRGPIAAVTNTSRVRDFFCRLKQIDSAQRPLEVFPTDEEAVAWLASRPSDQTGSE